MQVDRLMHQNKRQKSDADNVDDIQVTLQQNKVAASCVDECFELLSPDNRAA